MSSYTDKSSFFYFPNSGVCLCVCVREKERAWTCVWVSLCVHVSSHVWEFELTCVFRWVCSCEYVCVSVHVSVYACMHVCVCMHVCSHGRVYICIYVCMYICICMHVCVRVSPPPESISDMTENKIYILEWSHMFISFMSWNTKHKNISFRQLLLG